LKLNSGPTQAVANDCQWISDVPRPGNRRI